MSDLIVTQAVKLGEAFGMEAKGQELIQILKSTAFKGQVSDAQMAAIFLPLLLKSVRRSMSGL